MRTLLLFLFIVSAAGCGHTEASLRPYSAVETFAGITPSAVNVLEGDAHYVTGAPSRIVGTVTVSGGDEEQRLRKAMCVAARGGGTHAIRQREWSAVTGASTSITAIGNSAVAKTSLERTRGETYLVVRVERADWAKLPAVLRPTGVETFPAPVWAGDPALWECRD